MKNGASSQRRGSRLRRDGHIVAVLACLATFAAACSGSASPSPASSAHAASLAFAQCMRDHGYPRFPDPDSAGNFNMTGIDLNTPRGRSAGTACSSQVAPANPNPGQQNAQALSQALKFSRCMRAHGVTNFPDPNPDGQNSFSNSKGQAPLAQRAFTACRGLLPGPSSGGGSTP
jgi:hypothetical protein